jgi:hypothetical protein
MDRRWVGSICALLFAACGAGSPSDDGGASGDAANAGDGALPDLAMVADGPPLDLAQGDAAQGDGGGAPKVRVEVLFPPAPGQTDFPSVQKNLLDANAPAYPYVDGAVIAVGWSDFDLGDANQGAHTGYDFTIVDDAIKPWAAAGKKVNLVLQNTSYGSPQNCPAAGPGSHGKGGTLNCTMPDWMWTALGQNATGCAIPTGNQRVPHFRSDAFLNNYLPAIAALVGHAAGNPAVGYVRIGLGKGGEINLPAGWEDTTSACGQAYTTAWGYTVGDSANFTWDKYLADMLAAEGALKSPTQLMVSITPVMANNVSPDAVTDFIAPIAVANGIGFGNQGLSHADVQSCNGAAGDWCNLFAQFDGQVPLELQTLGVSCPAGFKQCAGLSGLTGPLPPLIQFALPNHATVLEIYYSDWLVAYDAANADHAMYGAAYQQALVSAATYQ